MKKFRRTNRQWSKFFLENSPPGDNGYTELVMRILQQAIVDALAVGRNEVETFERKTTKVSPLSAHDDIKMFFTSHYFDLYCCFLNLEPDYVRRLIREELNDSL